ncbi:MAG: pyridoxal phosphate-dependent aminotransferase [Candidatus Kerfeldbacteria bacterium]|nr:pyridoxal phosphate-dependent aminotransferase [Candidatus Kerfeldbacteria bacterium]
MKLADRLSQLGTEQAFHVLARAKQAERDGRDMIHMEIGDTDFHTPTAIVEAAITALHENKTKYLPSAGLLELRQALAKKISVSRGLAAHADDIVVTPGGKPMIFYTILATVNPGDEVIYPNPGFPTYESVINFMGGKAVPLQMNGDTGFEFDIEELRRLANDRTKLIIVNSPQNPTGGILSREKLQAIVDVAKQYDAWIFADEVYSELVFEGDFESILSIPGARERTIMLDAFTKTYSMSGWRVGYGLCPNADFASTIANLVNNSVSCAPNFTQWGAMAGLVNPTVAADVAAMRDELRQRRDLLYAGLQQLPGVQCHLPKGAIYLFPNITGTGQTSQAVYNFMFDQANIAVLPGTSFGQYGEGYIRMSFANNSRNRLQLAIDRLIKLWPKLLAK